MQNQDERDNKPGQTSSSTESGDLTKSVLGNITTLLFFIGGVTLVLSILVLLPMFLTYLSEGDYRPPSEIHPTDSVNKNTQNAYKPEQ